MPPLPGPVGRRPPQPLVPLATGLMWIIVGVVILIWLTASWKYVAGIVAIGIGVLFARGGLAALIRQSNRRGDD